MGRRQAGVGGHLPPVVELAEQALRPEDRGGLGADTLQPRQHGRRRGHLVTGQLEQGVPFRLDGLQLLQQDLEAIELADDLRLQVHRQRPAVACPQLLKPLMPTLAQRLVAEHPLGGEQPFDPVDVPHPLAHQRPALATHTPAVLLLRRWRPGHRTHPRLATLVGHPPTPARGQDRRGVDHVALDPNRRQVAAYAGLAPTPWQSGSIDHEQGVSKAGNPRLRTTMVELAWLWLQNQPASALSLWFHERVRRLGGRMRKTTIVALARKLLIALWRYITAGVVIEGAMMKTASATI